MNWISILFGIAAVVLFIRSAHLLRQPGPTPGMRSFGWVTLIVTVIALLLNGLIAQGMLVISPEFGIAMVQGGAVASFGLMAVLLAIGIVVGVGWHSQRRRIGRPDRRKVLIVAGIAFGVVAAMSTRLLNAEDVEALQIYVYDLWSPPLMLWAVTCLVAVAVAEPLFVRWLSRAFVIVFPSAVIALHARLRLEFAGDLTADLWLWIGLVVLPASWGIAGWLAVPWSLGGRETKPRRFVKAAVPLIGAALGVLAIVYAKPEWKDGLHSIVAAALPLLIALTWPVLLGAVRWRELWKLAKESRERIGPRDWAILGCVTLIAASLAEVFYAPAVVPASLSLSVFLLAWIAYSELLYEGTLYRAVEHAISGDLLGEGSPLRTFSTNLRTVAANAVTSTGAMVEKVFSADNWAVAVLKVVVVILLLVAVAEIPSAGKTVVLAMQTPPKSQAYDGVGQAVADHIANSLSALNEDLLPDLIVLKELAQEGANGTRATSHGSASLDAALSKSSDVKVFDTSIPVGALVAPVQAPMRALLGTRVVTGSLQESNGVFILLAESSTGESWRVTRDRQARDPESSSKSGGGKAASATAAESATAKGKATEERIAARTSEDNAGVKGLDEKALALASKERTAAKALNDKTGSAEAGPADAIPSLAEELAFSIRRGDPRLAVLGMTRSWPAFSKFRRGLRHWREFELTGSFRELTNALNDYRSAIAIDPTFALARYRLALALREDGQPGHALEELRASLHASPNFMPAVAALATTLWDFDQYLLPDPAAFRSDPPEPGVARVRQAEARELWQRILQSSAAEASAVDLASANYGLCREAYANRSARQMVDAVDTALGDMAALRDRLGDQGRDLRSQLRPGGSPATGTDPGQQDAEAVAIIAGEALQALSESRTAVATLRGLLASTKLNNDATDEALDRVEAAGSAASESLRDATGAGRRYISRRLPQQVDAKLVADAAAKVAVAQAAMNEVLSGGFKDRILEVRSNYFERAADQIRVAYFYCKRGQELYALIPSEQRSTPAVQRGEGLALNLLAAVLHTSGWQADPVDQAWQWHCRSEDYPGFSANAPEGKSRYERGLYAAAALSYYKRAAALLPEDPDIRCSGARVARALKNEAPMQALSDSVDARASLGNQWLELGFRTRDASFLKLAIDEFGAAILRNPYHVDSLNQYAYAAYLWRLFNVSGGSGIPVDPATLAQAETHARFAVALTARGHDPRKRIMVRSTLGEVLLAQNRSHESVEELAGALSDLDQVSAGVEHAAFDELRWDLRQAALCAALADERSGFAAHAKQLRDTADVMIRTIKESDRQREKQRFGDISRVTSALEAPAFCKDEAPAGAESESVRPPFVLARIKYGNATSRMCARNWVRGNLQRKADAADQRLYLDVRGGGSGVTMGFLPEGLTEPKAFTDNLRPSHQYYFAQLMEGGEPRSPVYPLQTYAPASGDCSRNLLTLEFEPAGASKDSKQKQAPARPPRLDLGAAR